MAIHIDPLEKRWIIVTAGLAVMTWAITLYFAAAKDIHPPSNVEVIDSARLHLDSGVGGGEFMENKLGVHEDTDGGLVVTMVAARYGFYPQHIELPLNTSVKFRIASFDVPHGVHVPFSNLNTMIVPGYVSEITTSFTKAGEFPIICNEYCGLGHAYMYGMINLVPKNNFNIVAETH